MKCGVIPVLARWDAGLRRGLVTTRVTKEPIFVHDRLRISNSAFASHLWRRYEIGGTENSWLGVYGS